MIVMTDTVQAAARHCFVLVAGVTREMLRSLDVSPASWPVMSFISRPVITVCCVGRRRWY